MNKLPGYCAAALLSTSALVGCQQESATPKSEPKAKNVILMIGDGMGPQQVGLLHDFALHSSSPIYKNRKAAIEQFADTGSVAFSNTGPHNSLVVDSACSATQLATGKPALSEVIGLDIEGKPVQTSLEAAKALGKATGLISDTRVTHATPGSFAAHQAHRSMENEIASDMLANNVDVMLGGGLRYWIPQEVNSDAAIKTAVTAQVNGAEIRIKSKRKDSRNLLSEATEAGYSLAFDGAQMQAATGDKLLGLFHYSTMLDGIAYSTCKAANNCKQPGLAEMTKKALDILSKDPDGFFLMVEGGQIDWAAHNNDAGDMLHQMLKFDESVQAVYDWVKDRNDTLVIITADHETGGFGFSYSRKDVPDPVAMGGEFTANGYHPKFNFADYSILDKLYLQKKDFYNIWYEAGGDLGSKFPTPESLMTAMNNNTEFDITLEQAKEILQREKHEYQVEGHKYLDQSEFPKVNDFKEFYVYGDEVHLNLMGRQLSNQQNTVWSTGTHTHTPVQVIAWGPDSAKDQFTGLMEHAEVGARIMDVVKATN